MTTTTNKMIPTTTMATPNVTTGATSIETPNMARFDQPPQPAPDADSEPFWQATAAGRLTICRCTSCGLWLQPPLERCRVCNGPTTFEEISGTGEVYSFIVVRQASVPGYLTDLPYAVVLVELDEQKCLRLPSRIIGTPIESIRVGMRVKAELVPLSGGDFIVPVFHAE
jgi:uncharacterized protein